jgi:two-component system response regulator YesN
MTRLMYSDTLPIVDTLSSIRAVDLSLGSAPFIQSVYAYNGRSNTYYVIGSDSVIRQGELYDQDIVHRLHSQDKLLTLDPIPRQIQASPYYPNRIENVFTYVIPEYFPDNQQLKNALIVNIRMEWIFSALNGYEPSSSNDGNHILLMDQQGSVIAHSNRSWFLQDRSGEAFIQEIRAAKKPSGTLLADVEGVPSVITYVSAASPEWTLITITPYAAIARTVNQVKTITLTIGLSMVVIGLITAFLLSRNLYSPVRSLRKSIGQIAGAHQPEAEHQDEFHYFQNTLQTAHSKLASLEMFRKSNIDALKQAYLKDLLLGKFIRDKDYKEDFSEFNVGLDPGGSVIMILFKIDHYEPFVASYNDRDQALLKYALLNIADEVVYTYYRCDSVDVGGDQVVTLLTPENYEEEPEHTERQIKLKINEIQAMFLKYCSISVSAFLSEPVDSLRDIRALYEQTQALSQYRLTCGHHCVLTQREMNARAMTPFNIDNAAVAQLLDEIKRARPDEAYSLYLSLTASLTSSDYNNIMFALSYLSSSLFNTLNLMEHHSMVSFELDFVSFDQRIKSSETLEQINAEFAGLFRTVSQKIAQVREGKNEAIVLHAMKFIQSQYAEKLLSPNMIADQLKLTVSYLNKLFRSHASESVAGYITEVRLTRAQELLRDSQLSVEEIIDRIGWENKKYFFTVYKKRFGVTPSEYRLKATIGELADSR